MIRPETLTGVCAEATRAHLKYGERSILSRDLTDAERLPILMEEVGEVARAMLESEDTERLVAELNQVAAVALAWIDALRAAPRRM